MIEEFTHQAQGFGKIVAVGNPFVHGKAQLDGVAEFVTAVLLVEGPHLFFSDDHEEGDGAAVEQVMIVGVHLDGTQVGDVYAGIAGVVGSQGGGVNAIVFHFPERPGKQAPGKAGEVAQRLEGVIDSHAGVFTAHFGYEFFHVTVHLFHGGFSLRVKDEFGHGFRAVVGELALDIESYLDFLALVKTPARNEPVHLGPKVDGLGQRGRNEMEPGIFEGGILGVFGGQILVHFRQVHHFSQDRLVLRPLAKQIRHHYMDRVQVAQAVSVPAVSPALLMFLHRCRF